MGKSKSKSKEIASSILFALIFVFTFQSLFFQPFSIPSGSMFPTLIIGDKVLIQKFAYGYSKYSFPMNLIPFSGKVLYKNKPKSGDIVVFKMPEYNNEFFIKRIIATPGDKLYIKNGIIYINDKPNEVKYIDKIGFDSAEQHGSVYVYNEVDSNGNSYFTYKMTPNGSSIGDNFAPITIPAGKYFVMGDNRDNSSDSRFSYIGFVNEDRIIGRARMIFFSSNAKIYEFWKWYHETTFSRVLTRLDK